MVLVGRPGYRIYSRTIKRDSRVSNLTVSFGESSNLCILGIIFLGSYLAFILVWIWSLSSSPRQAQLHRKRISYASSFAFLMLEFYRFFNLGEFTPLPHLYFLPWEFYSSLSLQQKWFHPIWSSYEKVMLVLVSAVLQEFLGRKFRWSHIGNSGPRISGLGSVGNSGCVAPEFPAIPGSEFPAYLRCSRLSKFGSSRTRDRK